MVVTRKQIRDYIHFSFVDYECKGQFCIVKHVTIKVADFTVLLSKHERKSDNILLLDKVLNTLEQLN